jgi:3-hydroxyacyl-[acyl-carrier-protein] dehydratase
LNGTQHEAWLRIAPDHPALPGHFPGAPVVPAVLLMDRVLELAEGWLGGPVAVCGLPQAKFRAPLLPDQEARVSLELDSSRLRFRVEVGAAMIAQGVFELASAPT